MLCAALLLGAAAGPPAPQNGDPLPPGVVAAWNGGQVSTERFELFLGRTFRGKTMGREALYHLLQIQLVEREATARGLSASDAELEERLERARREARQAGFELEELLAERGMDLAKLRKLLRDSLLHEKLVRADLGIAEALEVTAEQQERWTQERLAALLERAAEAPPGYALHAPPFVVSEAELGATLRAALGPSRLQEHLEQLVLQDHLEQWARQEKLALTDDLLQAEIEWRRQRVADNPSFAGMSYEKLLESQGSSLEAVRRSEELRAAGYLRLLARARYDDAWFAGLSAEQAAALEAEHGAARLTSWLLLRAVEQPVDPLDLSFEDAARELEGYAARARSPQDFYALAGQYSEHEASRQHQGLIGWVHRREPGVEAELCDAIHALPVGQVSAPLRTSQGMALVLVVEIRPRPAEEQFRELVRRGRHQELRAALLQEVGLRSAYRRQD